MASQLMAPSRPRGGARARVGHLEYRRSAGWRAARRLQERFGLRFPLVHASAEQAPFACAGFDLRPGGICPSPGG